MKERTSSWKRLIRLKWIAPTARRSSSATCKLKCVREVTVSYMAQKMLVEYTPGVDEAEAKAEILKTARKVEPDFRFED